MKSVPSCLKWRENWTKTFLDFVTPPPPPPPNSGGQNTFDWKWKKMKSAPNHPKCQDELNGRRPQL